LVHDVPAGSASESPSLRELARLSDNELMEQLRAGHKDALAVLFDRYHRLVLSVALRIVRDPGESEDVVQNVFLDVYRAVEKFDPAKGNTKIWILQYAYHRAINRRQYLNARRFYTQEDISDLGTVEAGPSSMLGKLNVEETKLLLRNGLATLSTSQRRVIELACYDGFSMKEIAAKTGEPLHNVRHHYYRGLEKLRGFVKGDVKAKAVGAGK
jgi:RNA polymerase sigma-70 factor (ECF subfamily)